MRAKYLSSAILVLLFLSASPAQQQRGVGSILVQVREEAGGRAIKYACVTVIPKEGEVLFQKADAKGRVRFRGLAEGSYRVVVKADGYEAQKRQVALAPGETVVEFNMRPRLSDSGGGER